MTSQPALPTGYLPPKPGHTITFIMPTSVGTLKVNRLITDTINAALLATCQGLDTVDDESVGLRSAVANRDRRARGVYVHGFGTDMHDTLVARFTTLTGEVVVHFPPNYHGPDHPSTTDWLRARVAVWDAVIFALGGPKGAGGVVVSTT